MLESRPEHVIKLFTTLGTAASLQWQHTLSHQGQKGYIMYSVTTDGFKKWTSMVDTLEEAIAIRDDFLARRLDPDTVVAKDSKCDCELGMPWQHCNPARCASVGNQEYSISKDIGMLKKYTNIICHRGLGCWTTELSNDQLSTKQFIQKHRRIRLFNFIGQYADEFHKPTLKPSVLLGGIQKFKWTHSGLKRNRSYLFGQL